MLGLSLCLQQRCHFAALVARRWRVWQALQAVGQSARPTTLTSPSSARWEHVYRPEIRVRNGLIMPCDVCQATCFG